MERAARSGMIAGPVEPPFPFAAHRLAREPVRFKGRLTIGRELFDGANPFAYEQEIVTNGAPTAVITSTVQSMSERLLADVATRGEHVEPDWQASLTERSKPDSLVNNKL